MIRKLFSHTAIYGLAPQVAKIAQIFVLPIITQDLTDLDFGVAGIMTAYTTAISVLAVLGLRVVLINLFYKSRGHYKWAWRQIYGFLILWNFFYAAILGFLIYLVVPEQASENRMVIMLLNIGPFILFGPIATIGNTYYQINQKPLQVGVRTAILGLVGVCLNLYFISYLKMGYMGWFWSTFLVGVISNFSYWYPMNIQLGIKPIFNFKWKRIKNSLKVSLPTVPHFYSGYLLNSSDKMVMDLLNVSTGDIGKYNVAYSIGNIAQQIGVASGYAVGPMMMEKYKKGDDLGARNLVFVLQILFLFGTFFCCIWLREIFAFLIRNETLANMYALGIIIIMSYNYRPMYMGANNKLFYTENTNVLWKVSFSAGVINLISNFLLIPLYGFEIAAFTTFVSLMFMGYIGFFLKIFRTINTAEYYPFRWLLSTILLTGLAYYLVDFTIEIKLIISFFILLTLLFLFYFFKSKINELRK
ncbi:lipopolysaccharide biosynthesis protein [Cyclobacterium sp.]|uniref:lipopolysaccharide biosynthesis protein n=1 Tax=Cyclobacterium sp. TaxID=1966343 RepID=UPI00198AAD25|nr:lipopolysaccharide biosynthesis protein [Cyclobacterium sp.]MBD3627917.1 lipopolysaccharide biosynthesis protein [Cyclobacterium sp.]